MTILLVVFLNLRIIILLVATHRVLNVKTIGTGGIETANHGLCLILQVMVITRPNTPLVRVSARGMTETEIVPKAVMPVAVMIILLKTVLLLQNLLIINVVLIVIALIILLKIVLINHQGLGHLHLLIKIIKMYILRIKALKSVTVTSPCLWGEAARPGTGHPSRPEVPRSGRARNDPPSCWTSCVKSVSVSKSRGRCEWQGHRGSVGHWGRVLWTSQLAGGKIGTWCRPHCVYLCTFDSCWPTFHLATRTRVTKFANRICRTLFNFYFYPGYLYIVTIEQKDNVDVNSAHSSSGATPEIPPLCDEAGSHVARGEEPSVSRPDTTDLREVDMSLTNVPSPESVVYDDVATSTPGPFPPLSGVFREPLGDLSRDPIIS